MALALLGGAICAPAASAKKNKKNSNVFFQLKQVNQSIPDRPAGGVAPPLASTIVVPKAFKGRQVADVNIVNLKTTGSAGTSADQLIGYLTAPNGRTLQLFINDGAQSLGPWTMDDESMVSICDGSGVVPCPDPDQSLNQPFAGTSNVLENWGGTFPVNGTLALFDGLGMRGAWTLRVVDVTNLSTSVLNQWGIQIRAAGRGSR